LLAIIDDVLCVGDQTSKEVADVLTALRGPDNCDSVLKTETTNVIRAVALPRTAKAKPGICMSFVVGTRARVGIPFDTQGASYPGDQRFVSQGHFRAHIANAAKALGIHCKG
jgi:hypothetical protein